MSYATKTYAGDAVTTDFAITFAYLDRSHVKVSVGKVPTTAVASDYTFTWNNSTNITVTKVSDGSAVPAGVEVKLFRETPIATPAVVFGGGSSLTSVNLNKNSEYLTYALQEATDADERFTKRYLGSLAVEPTTDNEGDDLEEGAVFYDTTVGAIKYYTGSAWVIGDDYMLSAAAQEAAEAAQAAAEVAQTAAEVAQTSVETALGSFDVTYLGLKASDPAVDNNGDALQAGALYLNSTTDLMNAYNGVAWVSYETGALAAQAAAEAAETNAGTAQTAAELAQTNAETAETAAELAQTNAETAQTNAETAESNAETAESNAVTAQTAAESARDAAFVNADVYATTALGRAAVADTEQFMVVDGDEIVRYRRDSASTETELVRFPSSTLVELGRQIVKPMFNESMVLANPTTSIWGNRDVVEITDADLNTYGFTHANRYNNVGVSQDTYYTIDVPTNQSGWGFGDSCAVSFFIKTDDWAGLNTGRLRLWTVDSTAGNTIHTLSGDYDQIRSDLRRYHSVVELTNAANTDTVEMWLEVTSAVAGTQPLYVTGPMFHLSEGIPGDIDWRNAVSNYEEVSLLSSIDKRGELLPNRVNNPAMLEGDPSSVLLGSGVVETLTDTYLNSLGITHAVSLPTLGSTQDTYGRLTADLPYLGPLSYIAYSFFVKTTDFAALNEPRFRAICLPKSGYGTQQNVQLDINSWESVATDVRRYFGVVQVPATSTAEWIREVWLEVTATAGRSGAVEVTGFTGAFSRNIPLGVEWSNFDPFSERDYGARLTALEGVAEQSDNGFLIPTSFHLYEGRPLQIYEHGLTTWDKERSWDMNFQGTSDTDQPFSANVSEVIELDGNRIKGAGYVYGRDPASANVAYRTPVDFLTVPAVGNTGSPNILMIGDSITDEGVPTKVKARLEAMGFTPNFIGTYPDQGGTLAEGRSSWEFSDFTYRHLFFDVANPLVGGSSAIYPIDATAQGDGVVTTPAEYLAAGSRFPYNPFIRPSTGGDAASIIENGYVFDLGFYLTRFSLTVPDVVTIDLGTNDVNSNDDATSLLNVTEGLATMVSQIQAAAPSCKIGIIMKGKGAEFIAGIRHVLETYGNREGEGIYVMIKDHYLDWSIYGAPRNVTLNSTDTYGVQTVTMNDKTHPDEVGKAQQAEFIAAFIGGRY